MDFSGNYTKDWKRIARQAKTAVGWRCVRCAHPHGENGKKKPCDNLCTHGTDSKNRVLTVHHLDGDKGNNSWWNLLPLCQVCHLQIQAKVDVARSYFFEHSDWFKIYIAGFYARKYLDENLTRQEVESRLDTFLKLERKI